MQQNQCVLFSHSQGQCKGRQKIDGRAKKQGGYVLGDIKQIGLLVTANC